MNAPATFPHGGDSRLLSALRYSATRKPSSSPTSMWLHGKRALTGIVPRNRCGSTWCASKARSHTSTRSCSSHESKRAPLRYAVSSTSHKLRSPRAKTPSSHEPSESCMRSSTRAPLASCSSHDCFSRTSSAAIHRRPLKGRVRLRHVRRDAHGHRRRRRAAIALHAEADLARALSDADDFAHVLFLLRRQADHEVELHARELAREDALGGLHELLFGDVLVHDVAHALASGLRRERDARGADARHVVERVLAEPVGAERAHAERDALGREALGDALDERRDARIVRGRERREAHLVVARSSSPRT